MGLEIAVQLKYPSTGLTAFSNKTRSQHENRECALRKLKREYALQKRHKLPLEKLTIPSSFQQYVNYGLWINSGNSHYPFMVKLILDVLD